MINRESSENAEHSFDSDRTPVGAARENRSQEEGEGESEISNEPEETKTARTPRNGFISSDNNSIEYEMGKVYIGYF